MTIAHSPGAQRIVFEDVSWDFYQRMLKEAGDSNLRLTYDRGRLEVMSPSQIHEKVKKILARIIELYADFHDIEIEGLGSTTFSREDLAKGLEPDECYYVANASAVIGREDFDLATDPPPDVAIEIDISPHDVKRQPIYGALGVPEIWPYDGRRLEFLHRQGDATYRAAANSLSFPRLPLDEVNRLVEVALSKGQTSAVRELKRWLQSRR